ncbi:MAG TPA: M48 family metalloprotease [Acidimicrobiales bacterium]|nr:M48 family metalloprotease [Acidimicrobiales bacterium]
MPAVVLGLILGFTVGWIAGLVAFVVVGAALGFWARTGGDRVVSARLHGRPADPRSDARLCNLVEGLCTGAGVRQPRLLVVDSDGLNALAAGTSSRRGLLAVTTGLLSELDRIELEAVLAEELWQIRHDEVVPTTVLAATMGVGRSLALGDDRDAAADQGAVSLTRYPPALASALEKIESKGAVVAGQPGYMAQLWMADPRPSAPPSRGRLPLAERIEALREL